MITTYGEWWRELAAAHKWTYGLPPRRLFAVITAIVLVFIALITTVRVANNVGPAHQESTDAESYPVAAADWLAAHPEVGTRMSNQYGWGGYLANRFYPDPNRRGFNFREAALMGDQPLHPYQDVQTLRPDWEQGLDNDGGRYILYNKDEARSDCVATQPD